MTIFYILDLILVSRILTSNADEKSSMRELIIKICILAAGFLFLELNGYVLILFILLSVTIFVLWQAETDFNLVRIRLLELVIIIPVLVIFCSGMINIQLNFPLLKSISTSLGTGITFLQ